MTNSRLVSAGLTLGLALSAFGCGGDEAPEPAPTAVPAAPSPSTELTEVEFVALMEAHYNAAIASHDALIRGDLATLRARLAELQERRLPPAAPENWRSHEGRLHEASRAAAAATDLESAGPAMASVAEACGSCHAAVGLGDIYRRPEAPEGDTPVETAMLGHQWATERLWEGVTGPWDDAWVRGADALAQSRVFTSEGASPTPGLQAREAEMRRLGEEAKRATGVSERAAVYGRVLATCGSCHTEAGVTFDAN